MTLVSDVAGNVGAVLGRRQHERPWTLVPLFVLLRGTLTCIATRRRSTRLRPRGASSTIRNRPKPATVGLLIGEELPGVEDRKRQPPNLLFGIIRSDRPGGGVTAADLSWFNDQGRIR